MAQVPGTRLAESYLVTGTYATRTSYRVKAKWVVPLSPHSYNQDATPP